MNEEQMKYIANLISQDLEKDKEIEKLNKKLDKYRYTPKVHFKETMELRNRIARANNIIKEVREYIELGMNFDSLGVARTKRKLLEILDKVEENK